MKPHESNKMEEEGQRFRFCPRDSSVFAAQTPNKNWLVDGILVTGQPAILGGPKKSLKTSVAIDLAVSLGSGARFLGRFDTPRRARVLVLSGESGADAIRDTAFHVCKARGVRLEECNVFWQTEGLPQLGDPRDCENLGKGLAQQGIELVIVDSLYLCLLGGMTRANASNLYEIGPLLSQAARACLDAGATPLFIHHATKSATRKPDDEAPGLDDLAFAGVGEFARQWLLLKRRKAYEPGTGQHAMRMTIGGSAGHSSDWFLDIREGKPGGKDGRWEVLLTDPHVQRHAEVASRSGLSGPPKTKQPGGAARSPRARKEKSQKSPGWVDDEAGQALPW